LLAKKTSFAESGHGIVFKCVEMGIMDVTIRKKLLGLEQQQKLGIDVKDFKFSRNHS